MSALSRVLCAVDIDDAASTAFAQALALARAHDARLLLVCPVPVGQPFGQRATERVSYLLKIRRQAEAAGVDVFTSVQAGEPAEIIVLHARDRRADLIVIAVEHGRSGGGMWGATAEDVLRSAPCPTLVVPAGATATAAFAHIIEAVDLEGDDAARGASMLRAAYASTLTVVHVVSSRRQAAAALERLQTMLPADPPHALGRVVVGSVARELLAVARHVDADLLVIRARSRSRVGRRLFGITRQLLERTVCPVLAIPDRPRDARLGTAAA